MFCYFLPVIYDVIPLFFSLSFAEKRHVIINLMLFFGTESELHLSFFFKLVLLLWNIAVLLFLLYLCCCFEILLVVLQHFIVFSFFFLNRFENVYFVCIFILQGFWKNWGFRRFHRFLVSHIVFQVDVLYLKLHLLLWAFIIISLVFRSKELLHGTFSDGSFGEDKFATSGSHLFFPINGSFLLHSVLIFKFVVRLIIDFLQIPLSDHKLSIFKIIISFVNIYQRNDDWKPCDKKSLNGWEKYLISLQFVVSQIKGSC